jgi:hypothetical protein
MAETFDPFALPSAFDPFGADALPAPRGRSSTAKATSSDQAERPAPPPLPRSHTNDLKAARLATPELAVAALERFHGDRILRQAADDRCSRRLTTLRADRLAFLVYGHRENALNARLDALGETTEARLTELEDDIAARLDDQMGRLVRSVATMMDERRRASNVDAQAASHRRPGMPR